MSTEATALSAATLAATESATTPGCALVDSRVPATAATAVLRMIGSLTTDPPATELVRDESVVRDVDEDVPDLP